MTKLFHESQHEWLALNLLDLVRAILSRPALCFAKSQPLTSALKTTEGFLNRELMDFYLGTTTALIRIVCTYVGVNWTDFAFGQQMRGSCSPLSRSNIRLAPI